MANGRYHKRKQIAKLREAPLAPAPIQMTGIVRLRVTGNGGLVDKIKSQTADLIDLCQRMKGHAHPASLELERLCAKAQDRFEEASMWATKAATL